MTIMDTYNLMIHVHWNVLNCVSMDAKYGQRVHADPAQ